jgi:hypothetical protein
VFGGSIIRPVPAPDDALDVKLKNSAPPPLVICTAPHAGSVVEDVAEAVVIEINCVASAIGWNLSLTRIAT